MVMKTMMEFLMKFSQISDSILSPSKVISALAVFLFMIAMYHLLIISEIEKEIIKSVYHIFQNAIAIHLMYYMRNHLKCEKRYSKHCEAIVYISIYFIYKIFLNIAYMFVGFRHFIVNFDTDIWSFILSSLILFILIMIKFTKR